MNTNVTNNGRFRDELDLLVDGELPEERRLQLLRTLDDEPGGWKECAQTFLEAQVWADALQEESAVPVRRRRWPAPLAAIAAAILGFAGATLVVPRGEGEAAGVGSDAPALELAALPVAVGSSLLPTTDDRGRLYYTTRGDVPSFILRAVQEAGHRVEYHERTVTLDREQGDPMELPVTETRILVNHSL